VSRLRVVVVGEAIAAAREVASAAPGLAALRVAGAVAAAGGDAMADELGESMADGTADDMADDMAGETIDALSVALSAAGGSGPDGPDSLPWQLSAQPTLRAERRDAHRRTRRARQSRRTVTLAQPLLFGQIDG
jgi:hypothetical protein